MMESNLSPPIKKKNTVG